MIIYETLKIFGYIYLKLKVNSSSDLTDVRNKRKSDDLIIFISPFSNIGLYVVYYFKGPRIGLM